MIWRTIFVLSVFLIGYFYQPSTQLHLAELPVVEDNHFEQVPNFKNFEDFNNSFQRYFSSMLKKNKIPGGAFTIVHNNEIVAIDGVGIRSKKDPRPVDENTIFRLASVSKTFAGALTGILAQQTPLDLKESVQKYNPEFTLANQNHSQALQLHHILSHSSGLMPNSYDNLLNANQPLNKIIKQFKKLDPICSPGKCYGYQNVIFSLVEPAIEQHAGQSYSDALSHYIFKPLDMKTASVGLDNFMENENRTAPHIKVAKNTWRQVRVKNNYYQVEPAAGVNASILDLAKWLKANMGNSPNVLSPQAIELITEKRTFTRRDLYRKHWRKYLKDAHYGLGWRIYNFEDHTLVYHAGWVSGYRAEIAYSPELKIGMAMLLNAESGVTNDLSTRFWQSLFTQKHLIDCDHCQVSF